MSNSDFGSFLKRREQQNRAPAGFSGESYVTRDTLDSTIYPDDGYYSSYPPIQDQYFTDNSTFVTGAPEDSQRGIERGRNEGPGPRFNSLEPSREEPSRYHLSRPGPYRPGPPHLNQVHNPRPPFDYGGRALPFANHPAPSQSRFDKPSHRQNHPPPEPQLGHNTSKLNNTGPGFDNAAQGNGSGLEIDHKRPGYQGPRQDNQLDVQKREIASQPQQAQQVPVKPRSILKNRIASSAAPRNDALESTPDSSAEASSSQGTIPLVSKQIATVSQKIETVKQSSTPEPSAESSLSKRTTPLVSKRIAPVSQQIETGKQPNKPPKTSASRGLAATLRAMSGINDSSDSEEDGKHENKTEVVKTKTKEKDISPQVTQPKMQQHTRGLMSTLMNLGQGEDGKSGNENPPEVLKTKREVRENTPEFKQPPVKHTRGLMSTLMSLGQSQTSRREAPEDNLICKDNPICDEHILKKEEKEESEAIEHSRGLMSTLINLAGPDVVNRPLDPLPKPRPMTLQNKDIPASQRLKSDSGIATEEGMADGEDEDFYNGFFCHLCRAETTCMSNFRDHLNGKAHKSMILKIKSSLGDEMKRPKLDEWYSKQDVDEYCEFGITRAMLEEANLDPSIFEASVDPDSTNRTTADPNLFCDLCKKQTTSLGNFRDHLNGKGHKSMRAKCIDGVAPPPKVKTKLPILPLGGKATSIILSLMEKVRQPVLGLDFITEYHTSGRIVCVCNLCASKFDSNAAVSHVVGKKHRLCYMREKQPQHYDHLKRFGGKKSQLAHFLEEICPDVEKLDGRGKPHIKIYEEEEIDPITDPEGLDQEERLRRMKVKALTENKVTFEDWVMGAVNVAERQQKPKGEDGDLFKTNWDIEQERRKRQEARQESYRTENKRETKYEINKLDEFLAGRRISPSRDRYSSQRDLSPPPRDRRRLSPKREPKREKEDSFYQNYTGEGSSRYNERPNQAMGSREPYHPPSRDPYRPPYDPYGPYKGASRYNEPYGDAQSRYISMPSSNLHLDPDPLKREVQPDRYIVPPSNDFDPDPLKRTMVERINYQHARKEEPPVKREASSTWDDDIQKILGDKPSKRGPDVLSMLNTYSSGSSRSPSPNRRSSKSNSARRNDSREPSISSGQNRPKGPFEKSYMERELEKKKKLKRSRTKSPVSDLFKRRRHSKSPSPLGRQSPLRRPASPYKPRQGHSARERSPPAPRRRAPHSPSLVRESIPVKPKGKIRDRERPSPSDIRVTVRVSPKKEIMCPPPLKKKPKSRNDDLIRQLQSKDESKVSEAISELLLQMSKEGGASLNPEEALKKLLSNPEVALALSGAKSDDNKASNSGRATSRKSPSPTLDRARNPSSARQMKMEPRSWLNDEPRSRPSDEPWSRPSDKPRSRPPDEPRSRPSDEPRSRPPDEPRARPPDEPRARPSDEPRSRPPDEPRERPSDEPRSRPPDEPRARPSDELRSRPPDELRSRPSAEPRSRKSDEPRSRPSEVPRSRPSDESRSRPNDEPILRSRSPDEPKSRSKPQDEPRSRPRPHDEPRVRHPHIHKRTNLKFRPNEESLSHPYDESRSRLDDKPRSRPIDEPRSRPIDEPRSRPSGEPRSKPSGEPRSRPNDIPKLMPVKDQPKSKPQRDKLSFGLSGLSKGLSLQNRPAVFDDETSEEEEGP